MHHCFPFWQHHCLHAGFVVLIYYGLISASGSFTSSLHYLLIFFLALGFYPSIFSENVVRLKSSIVGASSPPGSSPVPFIQSILSGDLGVVLLSVLLLHFAGFFVG